MSNAVLLPALAGCWMISTGAIGYLCRRAGVNAGYAECDAELDGQVYGWAPEVAHEGVSVPGPGSRSQVTTQYEPADPGPADETARWLASIGWRGAA